MKRLRIILIAANSLAVAALLAIPIGKLFGVVETEVDAAAVYGWLIFFVPLLASMLSLWGIQFALPALTRLFVTTAMPGSFLVTFLALYTSWKGPPEFTQIGIVTTILLSFNVFALWEPFKAQLQTSLPESVDTDEER